MAVARIDGFDEVFDSSPLITGWGIVALERKRQGDEWLAGDEIAQLRGLNKCRYRGRNEEASMASEGNTIGEKVKDAVIPRGPKSIAEPEKELRKLNYELLDTKTEFIFNTREGVHFWSVNRGKELEAGLCFLSKLNWQ